MKKIIYLFILMIYLTGCATTNTQTPQQIANAPLVSAGLISADMAKDMASDDADKIQQLLDTSQPQDNQTWKNKLTHDAYQFNSTGVSVNSQGLPCRTYQLKALIDDSNQQWQAQACRRLDGTWRATKAIAQS